MQIAFLGLGVMGAPMAGHLAAAGHDVVVHNRSPDKAVAWVEAHGGTAAPTPSAACDGADVVVSCVGGDEDVRAIALGEHGGHETLAPGAVWVDHTTTSPTLAQAVHDGLAAHGVAFVDAPISGGQVGAERGSLTVMAGGSQEAWSTVRPILAAYAKDARLLGSPGAGQTTKMVNQVCAAGLIQALAEGVHLAEAAGLDLAAVFDLLPGGAAGSWQMAHRWESMHARRWDHGFAVDWMRKDLGIVLAEAERLGVELPVTALVDRYYAELQDGGGGRWDTSALLERLVRRDAR